MSGHSKWSTIKHKKAITDNARGKVFSQLSKAIIVAIKTGGGNNPETNYKLKIAIDAAKAANMPKQNIERVLAKSEAGNLFEVVYEGFSPGGAGIIIEVATDNKNRSAQEIKQALEKGGGQFVAQGAVSYNFSHRGRIVLQIEGDIDDQMLELIDLGIEDLEEEGSLINVYVDPHALHEVKSKVDGKGFKVLSAGLVQKPLTLHELSGKTADRAISLLESLEDVDDVQNVFTNLDVVEK